MCVDTAVLQLLAVYPSGPIALAETGTTNYEVDKPQWYVLYV
jgi:hypothetical protein